MSEIETRRGNLALPEFWGRPALWVFTAALVARLIVLTLFSSSPHFGVQAGDMRFYHDWSLRIVHGEWTDHHAFYGLPGYAFFLAGFYAVFGVHPGVVLAVQAIVDATTATLVFVIARAVIAPLLETGEDDESRIAESGWEALLRFLPEAAAGLAALAWIFFVPAQTFSAVLMPTVLAVAGYWFCAWTALRAGHVHSAWAWLGLGVLIGGLAMFVATVLFAVPLLIFASVVNARTVMATFRKRPVRRLLGAGLLLLGVLIGTAPAWIHNRFIAKEPVFLSAHGGINFWVGNSPEANGYPKIPAGLRAGQQELLADSISIAEQQSRRPLSRAEVSHFWTAKTWAYIWQHPGAWMRLLALKVRNFWNAFTYDDVTVIALLREENVLLPGIGFGVASSLGLAGLLLALAGRTEAKLVAAAVLLHMIALLPVFITERYRLAAVPGLLVLSAYFVARLVTLASTKRWAALALSLLLVCGTTLFAHLPVPGDLLTSMEPYNLAISELEAGQLDRAQRHLEQAQALAPNNPSLLFSLGNLWLKKGDLERARGYYRQTLERDPRMADAYTNLGVIAMTEKRWDAACRLFEAALAIQPNDPDTRYLLSRAQAELKGQ